MQDRLESSELARQLDQLVPGHDLPESIESFLIGIASYTSASRNLAEGELVTQLHEPDLANHVHGDHLESLLKASVG